MATAIKQAIDTLPESGITVKTLQTLDFAVPGQWNNTIGLDNMIREVTGVTDYGRIDKIGREAVRIYQDPSTGYQRAMWIYEMVDKTDTAIGAAAMANKVGEKIPFLSFLNRLTPKADTLQTVDLGLKVSAELVAFTYVQGLPRSKAALGDFSSALAQKYTGESLMRMAALVCLDGVIPLGPNFARKSGQVLGNLSPSELGNNPMFKKIGELIPGDSTAGQLGFINDSYSAASDWMGNLVTSRGITTDKITSGLKGFIDFTDDKLDYLAAFLDMSTDYYRHTGTQSLARSLVEKAAGGA